MTVLAVLVVLESTLPSLCVSCKMQCQEATVTLLTVVAVSAVVQEKKKHININKFAGFSRDWVGAKHLFMCFLGSFLMVEKKTHKQNYPQNPGTIP